MTLTLALNTLWSLAVGAERADLAAEADLRLRWWHEGEDVPRWTLF